MHIELAVYKYVPLVFSALLYLHFCLPNSSVYVGYNEDSLSWCHHEKFCSLFGFVQPDDNVFMCFSFKEAHKE